MVNDWLLRVGNGNNFYRSTKYKLWGIKSSHPWSKYFLKNVSLGDRLWFVKSGSNGLIIAVSTFYSYNERILGELIDITMTNEELGWDGDNTLWDTEIHYRDLYHLEDCNMYTHIKCPTTIRKYDKKCLINLPTEYEQIVKYSKARFEP